MNHDIASELVTKVEVEANHVSRLSHMTIYMWNELSPERRKELVDLVEAVSVHAVKMWAASA